MRRFVQRRFTPVQSIAFASLFLAGCAFSPQAEHTSAYTTTDSGEAAWTDIPGGAMRIVVSFNNAVLYVLHDGDPQGELLILDRETLAPLHRIPVGRRPIAMAIEGETGYVVNNLSDDITAVNLKTAQVVKTVSVGHRPLRAAGSAGSPYLLVTNYGSDSVSVIDKMDLKVVKTLSSGPRPGDVAIHPNGRHAYLVERGAGRLDEIDLNVLQIVRSVPIGEFPSGLDISEDGKRLYVSDAHADILQVIGADRLDVVRSIPVGRRPVEVLRSAGHDEIFVLNGESKTLSVLDPMKAEAILTVPLKHAPRCMAGASNGERLYISYGESYGEITVLEMAGSRLVKSDSSPIRLMER